MPLISVIVPVYNVEKYVGKCLDSIRKQTYQNLELIIVDDGSNDSSGKICENYAKQDKRIRVIHQRNSGISKTRNIGVQESNGTYMTFVDSDDYVEESYIKTLYQNLTKNNCEISIVKHFIEYQNKTLDTSTKSYKVLDSHECLTKLLYDNDIDTSLWGKLYTRDLFKDIYFPEGRIFEDHSIFYKLVLKANKICLESKPLYHYRKLNHESITSSRFNIAKLDLIDATKQLAKDITIRYPDLKLACERRLMWAYLSTLAQTTSCTDPPKDIIIELTKYIQKNYRKVLFDRRTPNRDRVGILAVKLGYPTFRKFWAFYTQKRGL